MLPSRGTTSLLTAVFFYNPRCLFFGVKEGVEGGEASVAVGELQRSVKELGVPPITLRANGLSAES